MQHLTSLLALSLALSACTATSSPSGDDTGGDDQPGPDGGDPDPIVPALGVWTYTNLTTVSDTCDADITQEPGDFAIDRVTSAAFHAIPQDGTAPFDCTLTANRFGCGERIAGTYQHPSLDASITYRVTVDGSLTDATHAAGTQDGVATCSGSQCAAIASFPCTITASFKVRKK